MQLLKTCSDRGVAHEYFYDPPGRSTWSGGRARSVLDQVEQALVRPAAAGPCHGQLHPALDANQGGGTGATLGVPRRARLEGRAFVLEGRIDRLAEPHAPSSNCQSSVPGIATAAPSEPVGGSLLATLSRC